MAPFTVSALKEKASQVKSASIKSYDSTREKLSSRGTSGSTKPPPPPPPPRRTPSSKQASGGPPSRGVADVETVDWANLSDEDKQAFFAWLDEFFARYLGQPLPTTAPPIAPTPAETSSNASVSSSRSSLALPPRRFSYQASQNTSSDPPPDEAIPATPAPVPGRRNLPPSLSQKGPPRINFSTKPSAPSEEPAPIPPHALTRPPDSTDLQMSFPPPTTNGSAAADLAVFMHPSTPWDTEWYTSNPPTPPPLNGSREIRISFSFTHAEARGVVLFSDLSICWFSVAWTNGRTAANRWARFRPRPEPMSGPALRRAAETHGVAVAAFAERAAASGRPVAHGECWDIANEGILHASSLVGPRDAPIGSTSRAHGHLLFYGRPGVGRWRGGDDRLRAGDVVEWRSVRMGTSQRGGYAILGQPDHTAVLVKDTVPRCAVANGESVKPADVGVLTVVEQSAGRAPSQESYDLAKLQQGEFWVYRPVGMLEYLGSTMSIDIPSGLEVSAI